MKLGLQTPILEAIQDTSYRDFMISWCGKVPPSIFHVGMDEAPKIFWLRETIREAWNKTMIRGPIFCGKRHEIQGSSIRPQTCSERGNPCCGHPQASSILHTYGLTGMIAYDIDPSLVHPASILHQIIALDFEWARVYGTSYDEDEPLPEGEIPGMKTEMRKLERDLFEKVTQPWIQRVSTLINGNTKNVLHNK